MWQSIYCRNRESDERIKGHERDLWLAHNQTSAVSGRANEAGNIPVWNQVKFIEHDPHCYTRRLKEAIQTSSIAVETS